MSSGRGLNEVDLGFFMRNARQQHSGTLTHHRILFILTAQGDEPAFNFRSSSPLRERLVEIVRSDLEPYSDEVDTKAQWPEQAIRALQAAGFMGLHGPKSLGGHEQGLVALTTLCETLASCCPSTAICYGMHCVGTAVVAAKATPHHEENYLRPIAEGRHLTTLSLSESGTGSHFYLSQTELRREGDSYIVNGEKQFVTNGGHADSYVIST